MVLYIYVVVNTTNRRISMEEREWRETLTLYLKTDLFCRASPILQKSCAHFDLVWPEIGDILHGKNVFAVTKSKRLEDNMKLDSISKRNEDMI